LYRSLQLYRASLSRAKLIEAGKIRNNTRAGRNLFRRMRMKEKKLAIIPIEQKTTDFYGDEIITALVDIEGQEFVYVPLKPICEFLGVAWSPQLRRINRNVVLAGETKGVTVTVTPSGKGSGGGPQEMICLPLDYLNGWLFGINADRVKPEIQEQVIRYQRECYKVLSDAFLVSQPSDSLDVSNAPLEQVRNMLLAMARLAQEQIEFDERLSKTEGRLDNAANFFMSLDRRVGNLENRITPGKAVTMEQASELSQSVKTLAMKMGEKSGKNEFAGVYGRLYETFGITSYKLLPADKFDEAMKFLNEWYVSLLSAK
jgi:hypothetical protein